MPNALPIILMVIFMAHLAVFSWLAFKHKKSYHILAVITFLLLLFSSAQRNWWPGMTPYGWPLDDYMRWGAWAFTVLALVFFIRHKWR